MSSRFRIRVTRNVHRLLLLCVLLCNAALCTQAQTHKDNTKDTPIATASKKANTDTTAAKRPNAYQMSKAVKASANTKAALSDTAVFTKTSVKHIADLSADSLRHLHLSDSIARAVQSQKAKKTFIPNPQRALWLALVIPGGGQIYNRKYWKLPLVYGGFVGCIYALRWNNQMYKDYSQAYLDIMDDDPKTQSYISMLPFNYDVTANADRLKTLFKNKKNYFRRYRDMSTFCIMGVYLLSVIDAYVDAELSVFDISRDLSMKLGPTVINSGTLSRSAVGLQCSLNF